MSAEPPVARTWSAFPATALAVALVAWIAILAIAWPSYYGMNHATGTVAALADAALRGQSPGHDDGTTFLAALYFPPYPLLVAAAHRAGLDWWLALRATSLVSALALLVAALLAVRALGGGRVAAMIGLSLVLAAAPFKIASLSGRADLVAAALAVAAWAAWLRDPEHRGWATPALAAAAWLTKATGFTIPLAILWWAWRSRDRAGLARFGLRFAACLAAGVLITWPWHGPTWYGDVIRTLVLAPPNSSHPLRGPAELLRYTATWSELAAIAALAWAMLWSGEWKGRPAAAFCGASLAVTLLAMANRGSDHNHLVELVTAAAVCGAVWAERRLAKGALLVAAVVALAVVPASWRDLATTLAHARPPAERREHVIATVRAQATPMAFTEDPLVALAAGKRPALADPATLRSLERRADPRAVRAVERVARGEYGLIVLNEDPIAQAGWYRDWHLGSAVAAAIEKHYRAAGVVEGYTIERPR